ncbi:GNAT family N-acetyltransferase [Herbidospora cretacea]|uniref:GNAT family N-acetyltransferase n=1 Tax=Herbidospora cretacea TaxID=28444 RepID=UPI0007745E00|nr:GNAT family N-acetyltransferase [Herbidospora cretacea]
MRELRHLEEVVSATGGDDLLVWTAQRLPRGGARAWTLGEAVVVACPQVSKHDRLAVWGRAGDPSLAALVRQVWREMGTGYRPFGDREVIHRLVERMPGDLGPAGNFTWMTVDPGTVRPGAASPSPPYRGAGHESGAAGDRRCPSGPAPLLVGAAAGSCSSPTGPGSVDPRRPSAPEAAWLLDPGAGEEVARVLAVANPDAYARPGMPGISRWAGIRDAAGRLVTVGADAWSAPAVGFIGGVATLPEARGSGLAGVICRFLTGALLARHGRVSLMVDDVNAAALAVYRRLGYTRRLVAASRVPDA